MLDPRKTARACRASCTQLGDTSPDQASMMITSQARLAEQPLWKQVVGLDLGPKTTKARSNILEHRLCDPAVSMFRRNGIR